MKRGVLIALTFALTIVLAGCSLQQIKDLVAKKSGEVVKQDQQNEQEVVVTKEMVYANYDTGVGYIRLENLGLTAIPDFCVLLNTDDQVKINAISLVQNKIRVVNTDLSCLKNLKMLNLSYNEIQMVETLGDLPSLRELRLHKNAITTTENFPNFPALTRLTLAFNQLSNIHGLEGLTGLVSLELHHNLLEKLDGIESLKSLKQLKVEYNKLADDQIRPLLDKLTQLQLLTAKWNEVKEDLLEKLNVLNDAWVKLNTRDLGTWKTTSEVKVN